MGIIETAKQGIRFWIPCVEHYPGQPETKGEGPYPKTKGHIARVTFANIMDPATKAPVFVYGEAWFDNAEIIEHLVQHGGGRLKFDPAEIVTKGYMSPEQILRLGYTVPKGTVQGSAHEKAFDPTPPVLPDFNLMSKTEMKTWADDNNILVDAKLIKDQMAKKIKNELEKQGK